MHIARIYLICDQTLALILQTLFHQQARKLAQRTVGPVAQTVVDLVAGFTTDRRGVDAQITNWAWIDGSHRYILLRKGGSTMDFGDLKIGPQTSHKGTPMIRSAMTSRTAEMSPNTEETIQ